MVRSSNSTVRPDARYGVGSAPEVQGKLNVLGNNIARSMIGRTVDLLVDAKTIVHGVVIGVFTEAGTPKLVVGGRAYDSHQVLMVTPNSLY